MEVFYCNDIVRVCRVAHEHQGSLCLDLSVPGADYVPGVVESCMSREERHVCEYANDEIPAGDIDAILINKMSLNIVGGVLAICGIKPEDEDFWHDAARYVPSHFEDFHRPPPGVKKRNVQLIRAMDVDIQYFRGIALAENAGDLMPLFQQAQEKLRYLLTSSEALVRQLAEERVQEMQREWKSLATMGEKHIGKKGTFVGADFRSG